MASEEKKSAQEIYKYVVENVAANCVLGKQESEQELKQVSKKHLIIAAGQCEQEMKSNTQPYELPARLAVIRARLSDIEADEAERLRNKYFSREVLWTLAAVILTAVATSLAPIVLKGCVPPTQITSEAPLKVNIVK